MNIGFMYTIELLLPIYISTILSLLSAVFLLALYLKDNSIIDIVYGPTFALVAWVMIFYTNTKDIFPILISVCITLWALRLGARLLKKNWRKPEDQRYATWRREWKKRGSFYFIVRSYIQIFLLQGLIISIIGLPIVISIVYTDYVHPVLFILSMTIFVFGLMYESIADYQLDSFLKQKKLGKNTSELMTTGLFTYSRRPNYFGEITIWVGLSISVISTPIWWLAIFSPLTIWYIITFITGPMLEKIFLDTYPEKYKKYMETTNYLLPGPQK